MRRAMLMGVMVLMGAAMVAGSARALFGDNLLPLDLQLGTHASAAAAVLGIGLMVAAVNPGANITWVRAGILYGIVTVAYELGSHFWLGGEFFWGPVIFGIACSLLLIALYPQREKLMPPLTNPPAPKKIEEKEEPDPEPAAKVTTEIPAP